MHRRAILPEPLKARVLVIALAVIALGTAAAAAEPVTVKGVTIRGGPLVLVAPAATAEGTNQAAVLVDGAAVGSVDLPAGGGEVHVNPGELTVGRHAVEVRAPSGSNKATVLVLPGWTSLVPPLIAISLALVFKDVLVSLFLGVFAGALLLAAGNPLVAFGHTIDAYIKPALAEPDHASIVIFSTLLGGMVGIIGRSGGTQGIVDRLARHATTARRGQVATWLMGVFIFFDDYANTLIVGSTMRPVTDRLRISREKLAYIVDATAAPVASVVPISTWIGFEVGLIAAAFSQIGVGFNAYSVFVATIPFRFYPILALVLGFSIAFSCRDFGPMLKAELRASNTGKLMADDAMPLADYSSSALAPPPEAPRRALNALVPISLVIAVTLLGLYFSGRAALAESGPVAGLSYLQQVFAAADPFNSLLWASLAGVVAAGLLAVSQRILSVRQTMEGMVEGFKSMMLAMVVLILAWSIGAVCGELHTADYVVGATREALSPHFLPVLVFLVSAVVSFATGTSWGTMAILMPLVIPVSHGLSAGAGHDPASSTYYVLMLGTISSVLAGSVWGDHCSPISDTTVMSSMASGCDHIAHVRTQLPYAIGIGVLGMLVGDIPTAFGLSPWVSLGVGSVVIVLAVRFLGTRSDWHPHQNAAAEPGGLQKTT